MGVIYMTTNLINGKKYLGRDSNNNPNYLGSGLLLKMAIKKEGKHNFKKVIIEECKSEHELRIREEYWLNYYDAGNDSNFYNMNNISSGGALFLGRTHSNESKKKIGNSVRGEKSGMWGKKHSEKSKIKMGDSNRGEKHYLYGKSPSYETRMKSSKARTGEKNHMYGRRGELASGFRGYVVCIEGQYTGEIKTRLEWCDLLKIKPQYFSKHLHQKKYKNGFNGNFFKWEHEIQS